MSGEPESDIVSKGITWPRMVWVDGLTVSGTAGEGDSDPATIVISGLQPTQNFDVTVLAVRYNGTRTARKTDYRLVGASQTDGQIEQGVRIGSGEGQYASWEEVPFEEYSLTFEGVAPAADGTRGHPPAEQRPPPPANPPAPAPAGGQQPRQQPRLR